MKIGLMSDTHDNLTAARACVNLMRERGAEALIHAGDIISPFTARAIDAFNGPVYFVFGNNDGDKNALREAVREISEGPMELSLSGKRMLIVHDRSSLPEKSLKSYDYVIFGHTHKLSDKKKAGTRFINPGECGGWLTHKKTAMILDTETDEIEVLEVSD